MKRVTLAALCALMFAWVAQARPPEAGRLTNEDLLNGHKVVNIVDDFMVFWRQARGSTLPRARRLWYRLVEDKHREFFDRAVYRDAMPGERRAMLDEFLLRLPGRVDSIRRFGERAEAAVLETLASFKWRFPEYEQRQNIYVGFSLFTFDGSVRPVHNEVGVPDTLCLGAEVLAGYTREQLQVAIAHEVFHLYHFGFLFRHEASVAFTTAHLPLMVEGMAVAGSEAIYPNRRAELYLHFSPEELALQQAQLETSSQQFIQLLYEAAGPEKYGAWFARVPGERVPPRGGYLLGYEVTKRLLVSHSFEELVRLGSPELREHAEEQLAAIATGRVLLLAQGEK